ncbi:hypothetical protein BZG02_16880 [Labilibaculum filiforme]|uniref:histidine kinase n=1 Tax=Labilibaculum filiforme TaxID=1940526 RepID=A0A2N3HST6_9BACT|nr:PAS domain S-box protein [Labilibaculum filiforme]PKQ61118.1 hypothetical protein BZG02_16880 [Labilibaculum filiforme]
MDELKELRSNILELLYKGESEGVILTKLVKQGQRIVPGSRCAILRVDEYAQQLIIGAAPDLPDLYHQTLNGQPIKMGISPSSTVAFNGMRVVVDHIDNYHYLKKIRKDASKINLCSCWAEPIKDPSGKVLGVFAIYHGNAHTPVAVDIELMTDLANLTAIVLDRYRMITQLEESEKKYKILANASNEAVFIVDIGKIIEANLRATTLTGYSLQELSGMPIENFIQKEGGQYCNFNDSLENEFEFEGVGTRKDGASLDLMVRIKKSVYKRKNVCLLSVRDITQAKLEQRELKKLSKSVNQSPVSILITNSNGDIEYVNPKIEELTGYSFDELKGKNPRIFASGCTPLDTYKQMWDTIKTGNDWQGELLNKKKNGKLFWEQVTLSAITDDSGQIHNFLAIKEDISEFKRYEQIQKVILNISNAASARSTLEEFILFVRKELGKLIDTTNFFVALYNEESEIFHLPCMNDQFDYYESFPKRKTISAWVVDHQIPLFVNAQQMREMEVRGEVEIIGKACEIWLGMPLKNKKKVIGVLVIQSYDDKDAITEKDKEVLELVAHQISTSIEKKRAEEELVMALQHATESDRLKSAFLATMSHELRTPLNAIIGFSELVDRNTTNETAMEFSHIINQSGNHLLRIVEDLFEISLLQAGMLKIDKNDCTLIECFNEIDRLVRMEQKLMNKEHLELILTIPDTANHWILNTDKQRLVQVFLNLIKNALKFTERGQIEYGMLEYNRTSDLPLQFFVKDTGVGIAEDVKEIIFSMFRQGNEVILRVHEGCGIGLAISKRLVELLGGEIWVESKVGEGSVFYFTHPATIQ